MTCAGWVTWCERRKKGHDISGGGAWESESLPELGEGALAPSPSSEASPPPHLSLPTGLLNWRHTIVTREAHFGRRRLRLKGEVEERGQLTIDLAPSLSRSLSLLPEIPTLNPMPEGGWVYLDVQERLADTAAAATATTAVAGGDRRRRRPHHLCRDDVASTPHSAAVARKLLTAGLHLRWHVDTNTIRRSTCLDYGRRRSFREELLEIEGEQILSASETLVVASEHEALPLFLQLTKYRYRFSRAGFGELRAQRTHTGASRSQWKEMNARQLSALVILEDLPR